MMRFFGFAVVATARLFFAAAQHAPRQFTTPSVTVNGTVRRARSGIVSGCGRPGGTSQSIARRLACKGFGVVLVDNDPKVQRFAYDLRESADVQKAGGRVDTVVGDLEDPAVAARGVRACLDNFGTVEFVINTAGGSDPAAPTSCRASEVEHFLTLFRKNLITAQNLTSAAVPALRTAHGKRDVVFFSTTNGTPGWPWAGEPALAVAKAGVEALTRCWAAELRPFGVAVNCIRPASIPNPHSPTWATRFQNEDFCRGMAARYRAWGPLTAEQVAVETEHLIDTSSAPRTGEVITLDPPGLGTLGLEDPRLDGKWWLPPEPGTRPS